MRCVVAVTAAVVVTVGVCIRVTDAVSHGVDAERRAFPGAR